MLVGGKEKIIKKWELNRLASESCNYISDVVGDLAGPLFNRFPLDQEGLLHVGEVEIVVEFSGGPDFSSFNPAMIRGIIRNEIRLLAILEIQFDIFKECGLVAFDREVLMGFPHQVYVIGKLSLGEQSICGNIFSLQINGIAHGLAVYGQTLIFLAIGVVPALKGAAQMHRVNADQDIANDGETGNKVATFFAAAVETLSRFLAKAVSPIRDGLISPHSTQNCSGGNGQNCGKGMSPSLSAAGIGDALKEIRQGSHLLGF